MTPFLKNNIQIYFILVNIVVALIYLMTILVIIMSYRIKNKKFNILWPISLLKFCLPFFSVCFFGQIFLLLTTIFDCQNGFAYVSKELICRTGFWFIIDAPLSAIAMALLALIALITNNLYYKSSFVRDGSDILKKTNCRPDVILLFTKIAVIITFILDDGVEDEHWAVLFFLILFTGINTYINFKHQNRINIQLKFLNNVLCLMPFLGFTSLLIGKIFKFLGFNGAIFLFFSWILFGAIFILLYKRRIISFTMINYNEIQSPQEYIDYIHNFYSLIVNKNNSRSDYTILKSLISKIEMRCINNHCPLKYFVDDISNEIINIFPLLQYIEQLFEYGISKFPNNISLRINFTLFLIMEMNHNKKALINLSNINSDYNSFQDSYNIYRCKRLIDIFMSQKNKNLFNSFEYKIKIKEFRLMISKITSLYYDFWTLITINRLNSTDNLDELNRIGSEMIKMNKKIDESYNSLIKLKSDSYSLIKLYTYFFKNILNDNERYKKRKLKSQNSPQNIGSNPHEVEFSNFDINILKEKDLFKYLILSANKKDLGNIIDFSTNICQIFGYNKNELMGKNINFLIPEIFHKEHDILLSNFNEKSNNILFEDLYNRGNYIPEYLEKEVYAISKSKLMIPIKHKAYLVQTERNELVYIIELTKLKDFQKDLNNNEFNSKCVILTDSNFNIKSFTPNCVNYLKLDDSFINSNNNIINNIKQLNNDYLKKINEIYKLYNFNSTLRNTTNKDNLSENQNNHVITYDNISYKEKKKIKKDILEKYYLGKNEIIWRIKINTKFQNDEGICNYSIISWQENNNIYTFNKKNYYEDKFLMEIKKITINKELLGYYFIFKNKSKALYNENNYSTYVIMIKSDAYSQSDSKRKKYQYKFKNDNLSHKINTALFEKDEEIVNKREEIFSPKKVLKFRSNDKIDFINKNFTNENQVNFTNATKEKNTSLKYVDFAYKSDTNNDENEEDFTLINEDFVPTSSFKFAFDLSSKCYKSIYETKVENENKNVLNDILKFQALNKINNHKEFLNKKKEEEDSKTYSSNNIESNESEESENEDKEIFSSSINDSHNSKEKSDINLKRYSSVKLKDNKNNNVFNVYTNSGYESENQRNKQIAHKHDMFNSFYKVNLNKIHFLIYDFNKDMIIDAENEKTSKIENIIRNTKQRLSVELKSTDNYPNIIINNIKDDKKGAISSKDNLKQEPLSEEKSVENKIIEAINKENDEDDIIRIYKYSFIGVLILLICASLYLYFEINLYLEYRVIMNIIRDILSVKYCNKISLYYIRELTLLNTPDTGIRGGKYLFIPANDRDQYTTMIKKNILELFMESQMSMVNFIGSQYSLSKDLDSYLDNTKLIVKLSNSVLKSSIIKNNVIVTIVQLNSAFYNLASSTSPIEQNHADLYNFVYNSLNNFGLAIDILINTYKSELDNKARYNTIFVQIQMVIYFFVFFIIYIAGTILFSKIIQRKKSYTNVFMNINFDFVISSINKCEQFINKFKLNEENKIQEEEVEDASEEKASLLQPERHFKESKINLNSNSYRIKNKSENQKKFEFSHNFLFRIIFGLFLLIIYSFYFILGFYNLYRINIRGINITKFYYYVQHYHLNIIEYFNVYREYLFDNGSIIESDLPFIKLMEKEKIIYGNWTEDINNINRFTKTLIDVNENIASQLDRSLCSYNITDYFKDEEDCIKILGNSYNQDINTFASGFIDELRIKKNVIRLLYDANYIIGNLTEYKTENWFNDYNEELNANKAKYFRLDIFNNEFLHSQSNLIFINVILPCLDSTRKIIISKVTIVGRQITYYILISIFVLILMATYFFYWIPKIRKLNRIIYETKNMLKIIPMNILMSDNNIINLLQVSKKK